MKTDLIAMIEYCEKCQVDTSFVISLEEVGIIDINVVEGERYLWKSQLGSLERCIRLHYDLNINTEGLDVIERLLNDFGHIKGQYAKMIRILDRLERTDNIVRILKEEGWE